MILRVDLSIVVYHPQPQARHVIHIATPLHASAIAGSDSLEMNTTMSADPVDSHNIPDDRFGPDAYAIKLSAPSSRISSVLSASYADSDIREALRTLDRQNLQNTPETRRRFRLDVQRELLQRNGMIIQDFGHVAEVRAHRLGIH